MRFTLMVTLLSVTCIVNPCTHAHGMTMQVYDIPIPTVQRASMNPVTNHYSVDLIDGKIYSEQGFFQSLFSRSTRLVGTITVKFGNSIFKDELTWIFENTDLSRLINRPSGVIHITLIESFPAEVSSSFTLSLLGHSEDRLTNLLNDVKKGESLMPAAAATPIAVAGYAAGLITKHFIGTSDPRLTVSTTEVTIKGRGAASDAYLIAIAPLDDSDQFVATLDKSLLSYSEAKHQLLYNGRQVNDHTYYVLKVTQNPRPVAAEDIMYRPTPWGAVGRTITSGEAFREAKNRERLVGSVMTLLSQLDKVPTLLESERLLSSYDRATIVVAFGKIVLMNTKAQCKALKIQGLQCPDIDVQRYIDNLTSLYNMEEKEIQGVRKIATSLADNLQRNKLMWDISNATAGLTTSPSSYGYIHRVPGIIWNMPEEKS